MTTMGCRPLGPLGCLVWMLLELVAGDLAPSEAPRRARAA